MDSYTAYTSWEGKVAAGTIMEVGCSKQSRSTNLYPLTLPLSPQGGEGWGERDLNADFHIGKNR